MGEREEESNSARGENAETRRPAESCRRVSDRRYGRSSLICDSVDLSAWTLPYIVVVSMLLVSLEYPVYALQFLSKTIWMVSGLPCVAPPRIPSQHS